MPEQSTGRPWSKPAPRKGVGAQIADFKDLVVAYAKQETIDPLRTLGRYLGFGVAGSVVIAVGLGLLLLALLRGLQQIELFNDPLQLDGGTWSWAPYLITGAVGLVVAVLFLGRLISMAKKQGTR
ncbi:MAG: phage holin family protein [Microthrixaceae bacterium]